MAKKRTDIRIDQLITVDIRSLTDRLEGEGKIGGLVVQVPGAFPGDRVRARVISKQRAWCRAMIETLVAPSPMRVTPACNVAHICGGCPLMPIRRDAQIEWKRGHVESAFTLAREHAPALLTALRPIQKIPIDLGYRGKGLFPVRRIGNRIRAGLYRAHSHEIVPIDRCPVQGPVVNRVLRKVVAALEDAAIEPYSEETGKGVLRFLLFRESFFEEKVLLGLIVQKPLPDSIGERILAIDPGIAGVIENINTDPGNRALGPTTRLLRGRDRLIERVDGRDQPMTLAGFSQVNPRMAERLIAALRESFASADGNGVLVDLYAGAAPFGIALASRFKKVIAIESEPEAACAARDTADALGLTNLEIVNETAEVAIPRLAGDPLRTSISAVVLDPPRKGAELQVLKSLCALGPTTIAYVSCNARSFARDAAVLLTAGYQVESIQPFDMFPHTEHVELLGVFRRQIAQS